MLEAARLKQRTMLRPRDAARDRLLRRRRELLDAPLPTATRRAAVDAAGLLPGRLPAVHRRVAHLASRRCAACTPATARARKCWSTTASGCRRRSTTGRCNFDEFEQHDQAGRLSCRRRPARTRRSTASADRRAGDSPDRAGRPGDRGPADQGPDRRSARTRSSTRVAKGERVLVTTLTKRMAEDLADYLKEMGVRTHYLH